MELSLEIPLPHIEEFLPLTDFPFGLAHLCLEDPVYCRLMKGCLLDNGMYELGESLPVKTIVRAATLVNPVSVIAPDWEGDMKKTLHGVEALYDEVAGHDPGWTVGALVQGKTLDERNNCFYELKRMGCRPIGFPFRSLRASTIMQLHQEGMFDEDGWYHLFGLRDNNELKWKLPGRWTVDTGKPFKGFRMDQEKIRGHGRLNLHVPLPSPEVWGLAAWNIAWMRKQMNA